MSIRKKLLYSIVVGGGVGLLMFGLVLARTYQQVHRAIEQSELISNIVSGVFELTVITNDYLLYQSERAQTQWEMKYSSLNQTLSDIEVSSLDDQVILDEIKRNYNEIQPLFLDLVEIYTAGMSDNDETNLYREVEQRLIGQLSVKSQRMVTNALRLESTNNDHVDAAQRGGNILLMVSSGIIATLALLGVFGISSRILEGVDQLRVGTEIIASGNLDHRVEITSNDEIGHLASAFNEMATHMQFHTARLEQSNRDLEEFAYIASHDLQEPLRKILAFSDRLMSRYSQSFDETGQDYINRMHDATRRMQALIDDLLVYSRVSTQAQPPTQINLTDLIKEVVSDLESQLQHTGGRVEFDILPTIEADPAQIHQLLKHLIVNALKFHREGVSPQIKLYGHMLEQEGSTLEMCQIIVEDNGIGFKQQFAERIFKPFQRLHPRGEYSGSGMGLAICRRIVERHNGRITANSGPGKGATFIVTLPVKQSKEMNIHE